MTFAFQVARDIIGNSISFVVKSDPSREIVRVRASLDFLNLGDDRVNSASTHFERSFRQAGNAGPGTTHTLTVEAFDETGAIETGTKIWVDNQ
ncbi:MAG TPA: hypothetical protein VNM67_25085 [Thermoanaerobaculia bacterium]|jgi:hypothetical protein|nr:hypothetical protein [Thermoanaerobaculia bacterium]